jgi:hypothetical protein
MACFLSIAFCALLLLQSAGAAPPVGVSWGDGARDRAYGVEVHGSIAFATLSGVRALPPNCIISFTGRPSDAAGFHYFRYDLVALTQDRKPLPGVYGTRTELRIATGWPLLLSLVVPSLCLVLLVKKRRTARNRQFCRDCGYDLRATPDRCPECGLVAAAPR